MPSQRSGRSRPAPGSPASSCVFLPRGAFRFFRVTDSVPVELSRDGVVTAPKTRANVLAQQPAAARPVVADGMAEGGGTTPDPGAAGSASIPPAEAPPSGVSSKNFPGQFFSSSRSDDLSHVGENTYEGEKGDD